MNSVQRARGARPVVVLLLFLLASCNYRVDKSEPPAGSGGVGRGENPASVPAYATVQSEVFERHCTSCHGGAGGVNLESYGNVKKNLNQIADAVMSGRMPKRDSLSAKEKELLFSWIGSGAPEFAVTQAREDQGRPQ
jgi:mono/diheme cytochrome c family protein